MFGRTAALLACLVLVAAAEADTVYKYRRPDGRTIYSNKLEPGLELIETFEYKFADPAPARPGAAQSDAEGEARITKRHELQAAGPMFGCERRWQPRNVCVPAAWKEGTDWRRHRAAPPPSAACPGPGGGHRRHHARRGRSRPRRVRRVEARGRPAGARADGARWYNELR
jgi:hypothetical protein